MIFSSTLRSLEMLRMDLYLKQGGYQSAYPKFGIGSSGNQFYQPIVVNGYPVFQFRYEGAMPLYDEKNKKLLALVRDYYYQATLDMYEYSSLDICFDKAALIIQHVFPQHRVRDADNRNRKYLIDAIRFTELIYDDSMDKLLILEEGYIKKGTLPYVNALLLDSRNLHDFLPYREEYALKVFKEINESLSWDNFEKKYAEFLQRKMENERAFKELF